MPDGIGHGASSKPSDGLHARFPHYGYATWSRAQHLVLTEALRVDHLRLVMGTSMGGMQTWLWGEPYPALMDAPMPLASLPVEIAGRNRVWRMIVDDPRGDPGWNGGDYRDEPRRAEPPATSVDLGLGAPLRPDAIPPRPPRRLPAETWRSG